MGRVCRPESPAYREETGGDGGERETWLIDVTEPDEAKEGAVTKVDFAMAPPRTASSNYRDGNELTTEAGSFVDTTQTITHDKYCAMMLTFSSYSVSPPSFSNRRRIIPRQSGRQRAAKIHFCPATDFCPRRRR